MVGVDSSPEQVWAALQRGLDARIVDACELPFDEEFDAVFSNAVLHWVRDADAAIDAVWRALRPGGRFVAECGGAGCVASVRECFAEALAARGVDSAAVDPWYFPTADEYRARLERRGFRVDSIQRFPRPTPLPGDVVHWLEVFAQPFIGAVAEPERPGPARRDARTAGPAHPAPGRHMGGRLRPTAVRRRPAVAGRQPVAGDAPHPERQDLPPP